MLYYAMGGTYPGTWVVAASALVNEAKGKSTTLPIFFFTKTLSLTSGAPEPIKAG